MTYCILDMGSEFALENEFFDVLSNQDGERKSEHNLGTDET